MHSGKKYCLLLPRRKISRETGSVTELSISVSLSDSTISARPFTMQAQHPEFDHCIDKPAGTTNELIGKTGKRDRRAPPVKLPSMTCIAANQIKTTRPTPEITLLKCAETNR